MAQRGRLSRWSWPATVTPGPAHPFGTDQYGRDILVRTIYGARISMGIGLISVGISLAVGLPLGAVAGYYGRTTEQVIMRVMDMLPPSGS